MACTAGVQAQTFVTAPLEYNETQVYHPEYGIKLYDRLNYLLGGDSIRYDQQKGYAASGWREDKYENGQLLHKGYYEEGKLKIYKNYFDNGQLERTFYVKPNPNFFTMKVYYKDGKQRSEIEYKDGAPQKWQDWYPNGQLEFIEEYDKDLEYFIQQKSYLQDGTPQAIMELIDEKKKIYSKKEYHQNGKIKEEGNLVFDKGAGDYRKDGVWKVYDETGKLIEENIYVKGELSKSVKK